MENIKYRLTFKDEKSAKEFIEYSNRFDADLELQKKIDAAESEDQIYEALMEGGYINMSFQDFLAALDESFEKIGLNPSEGKFQLNMEELESVAGGHIFQKSWWQKNGSKVKSAVKFVPFLGGTAVSIWNAADGTTSGWEAVGKIFTSVAMGAVEVGVAIGTGGASIGAEIAIEGGTYLGTQTVERAVHAAM